MGAYAQTNSRDIVSSAAQVYIRVQDAGTEESRHEVEAQGMDMTSRQSVLKSDCAQLNCLRHMLPAEYGIPPEYILPADSDASISLACASGLEVRQANRAYIARHLAIQHIARPCIGFTRSCAALERVCSCVTPEVSTNGCKYRPSFVLTMLNGRRR
jgi:hypothetical protein